MNCAEKKNIALIYGGDSSEHGISVQSGKNVASQIDRNRYNVYEILQKGASWSLQGEGAPVEVDKSDFSVVCGGKKIKFDMAFIMIHGTPGENGLLQAYFEMLGIPFNTCSSFVSAMTFDKYACKSYLREAGVGLAKDMLINRGDRWVSGKIAEKLGLPLFVKPTDGGSSFGVTKVKKVEDIDSAIEAAFKEGKRVIVEQFIPGRELTNGVYCDNGKVIALPVTEIISHNEYFDYEAKYNGESDEVCPAQIPDTLKERIQEMSVRIYRYLGCSGLVRMDYIVHGEEIYFLEMNTVPGMTKMSLVPRQVAVAGMDLGDFFNMLIDNIR